MDLANLVQGSWPSQGIDVYGPSPAGLPIPTFPLDAVRPLVFADEPTPGMRTTVEHLLRAFAYNINLRIADEDRSNVVDAIRVREVGVRREGYVPDIDLGSRGDGSSAASAAPPMEPVVVHPEDDQGVQVSAVLVQHAPVFPAFGFRFDTPVGSVVFSGDTGPCENVVRLARGADVLVHEVIDVDRMTERLSRLPNHEAFATTSPRRTRLRSRPARSPRGRVSERWSCPTWCPATSNRRRPSGRRGCAARSSATWCAASTSTSWRSAWARASRQDGPSRGRPAALEPPRSHRWRR